MRQLATFLALSVALSGCGSEMTYPCDVPDGGEPDGAWLEDGGFMPPDSGVPPLGECRSQRFAAEYGIVDHGDCARPGSGGPVCNPWFDTCQGAAIAPGTWTWNDTSYCMPCSDVTPCDPGMVCTTFWDVEGAYENLEQVCLPGAASDADCAAWPGDRYGLAGPDVCGPPLSCRLPHGSPSYSPVW